MQDGAGKPQDDAGKPHDDVTSLRESDCGKVTIEWKERNSPPPHHRIQMAIAGVLEA
jgi:hypothetical protein